MLMNFPLFAIRKLSSFLFFVKFSTFLDVFTLFGQDDANKTINGRYQFWFVTSSFNHLSKTHSEMKHLSSRWARSGELKRRIKLPVNCEPLSKTNRRDKRKKNKNEKVINLLGTNLSWESSREIGLPSSIVWRVARAFKGPGTHNNGVPLCCRPFWLDSHLFAWWQMSLKNY